MTKRRKCVVEDTGVGYKGARERKSGGNVGKIRSSAGVRKRMNSKISRS
jgi:hypothetical protein